MAYICCTVNLPQKQKRCNLSWETFVARLEDFTSYICCRRHPVYSGVSSISIVNLLYMYERTFSYLNITFIPFCSKICGWNTTKLMLCGGGSISDIFRHLHRLHS